MQRCWSMSPVSRAGHKYFRQWCFLEPIKPEGTDGHFHRPQPEQTHPSRTMVRARTLLVVVTCCCAWLRLASADDSSLETRSSDFPIKTQQEKDLVRRLRNEFIVCISNVPFLFVCFPVSGHDVCLCCSLYQIDALQEVLEKLRSKEMPLEKKLGWLPSVCLSACVVWQLRGSRNWGTTKIWNKAEKRMFYGYTSMQFLGDIETLLFDQRLVFTTHLASCVALVAVWRRGAVRRA